MVTTGRRETMGERLGRFARYSYRQDPRVPMFDDRRPLIVFDGVCVLCSRFAKTVARSDRRQRILFTAGQSELGTALFRHYGLDPVNYETNLLIANGHPSGKMAALVGISRELGGWWRCVAPAGLVPDRIGDRIYDAVAQNRYRLFGRHDVCLRPDQDWRDRVID